MWSFVFCKEEGCQEDSYCWSDCRERIQHMLERHDDWNLSECFDHIRKEQVRSVLPRQTGSNLIHNRDKRVCPWIAASSTGVSFQNVI